MEISQADFRKIKTPSNYFDANAPFLQKRKFDRCPLREFSTTIEFKNSVTLLRYAEFDAQELPSTARRRREEIMNEEKHKFPNAPTSPSRTSAFGPPFFAKNQFSHMRSGVFCTASTFLVSMRENTSPPTCIALARRGRPTRTK